MLVLQPLLIIEDDSGNPDILNARNTTIQLDAYKGDSVDQIKLAMEADHLNHFKSLVDEKLPEYSFQILGRGKEPPDFEILRGGKVYGIELTMFIFEKIRQEVKFFSKLQEKLLTAYSAGWLENLAGIEIEIIFGDQALNYPTKINDSVFNELIASLNKLSSRPFELSKKVDIINDTSTPYPLSQSGYVGNGLIYWYVAGIGRINTVTDFSKVTGFEISHNPTVHGIATWFAQLDKIIMSKDLPKNTGNELLISVGMPDMEGLITTIEEIGIFRFIEEWKKNIKLPTYLIRVFLDCWGSDQIFILFDSEAKTN